MKHLIIYCHPNPKSFNHAILSAYLEAVQERGEEAKVRDLYAQKFSPVLTGEELAALGRGKIPSDLHEEHEHIRWAEVLTFIYPLWWGGMPALGKGYIDRVFCDGFAYGFSDQGLQPRLTDKKVLTITTLGDSLENYKRQGFLEAMDKLTDGITYAFAGVQSLGHLYFGSVGRVTEEERKKMLKVVRERVLAL